MSITSFQTGTLSFASGDLTKSATLSTTVTQGNSILIVSARGGNNTVEQAGVRVGLSSDGTTVTATRVGSGSTLTVEYQVVESSLFTVQHFEETLTTSGTNAVAITSVDTNYSFPVYGGLTSSGSTRGWDDVYGLEITSSTNVNAHVVDSNASSVVVNFQIVEMSANEIASVQLHKVNQQFMNRNTTITSVDTSKTLLFGGAIFNGSSGGDMISSEDIPDWELTTSTNLKTTSFAARNELQCWIYVVEFVDLAVNTVRVSSSTSTTETEVLGASPTYGGALINGIMGKYSSADDTDDDSNDNMWSASLSGSTWTFERGASTIGSLSYSTFDWNDLASGPVITDVDTDETTIDGQSAVAVTVSGFGSDVTSILYTDGTNDTANLLAGGTGDNYTINLPDVSAYSSDTTGVPFGSLTCEVTDGTDTATISVTHNVKSGWATTTVASAVTGDGSIFETIFPDGSQIYYDTSNNTSVDPDGIYTTDGTEIDGAVWNTSNATWVPFTVNISELGGDTEDPTVPTNVNATSTGTTTGSVTWTASTDNTAVTGYRVFVDSVEDGTTASTSYSITGLSPDTTYSVTVSAYDAAGNESAQSTVDNFTTNSTPLVIVSVDDDEVTLDGQQGVAAVVSGFTGDIDNFEYISGSKTTNNILVSGSGNDVIFNLPDITLLTDTTAGIPFTSASNTIEAKASYAMEEATIEVTHNPKTGWAVVEVVNGSTSAGSVFNGRVGGAPSNSSQILYPTAESTSIAANGDVTTSANTLSGFIYDSSAGTWETFTMLTGTIVISNISVFIRDKINTSGGRTRESLPAMVEGATGITGKTGATLNGIGVTSFTVVDDTSCAFIMPTSGQLAEGVYSLDIEGLIINNINFSH